MQVALQCRLKKTGKAFALPVSIFRVPVETKKLLQVAR
jgi:hypothetical protein